MLRILWVFLRRTGFVLPTLRVIILYFLILFETRNSIGRNCFVFWHYFHADVLVFPEIATDILFILWMFDIIRMEMQNVSETLKYILTY